MGDYTMAAAQSIAGNIQEERKKQEKLAKDLGESDILLDYARQHNLVTPEEETKYNAASANQKVGMAEAWSKAIALNQAQELQQAQLQNQMAIAKIHAGATLEAAKQRSGRETYIDENAGTPVIDPNDPEGKRIIGYRDRYGVPHITGGMLPGGPGGKNYTIGELEQKQVPGSGKGAGNPAVYVTVDKQGHIVPNAQLQGIPRPDPFMTQYDLANRAGQQQPQQRTAYGDLMNWMFPPKGPAAAPAPPDVPGPVADPLAGTTAPIPAKQVPPAAADALKKDPSKRDEFDAYYGAGSAARVLGY